MMILRCVFCNNAIDGLGYDADPLGDGRCCDTCNSLLVIPHRIRIHYRDAAGKRSEADHQLGKQPGG